MRALLLSTYLYPYLIMLNVKQRDIKYHFFSLWYYSIWDWTLISWTIDKHSDHYTNTHTHIYIYIYIYIGVYMRGNHPLRIYLSNAFLQRSNRTTTTNALWTLANTNEQCPLFQNTQTSCHVTPLFCWLSLCLVTEHIGEQTLCVAYYLCEFLHFSIGSMMLYY